MMNLGQQNTQMRILLTIKQKTWQNFEGDK